MARVGRVRVVLHDRAFLQVNTGPVLSHVRDIAADAVTIMKATAPKRTGELARLIGRSVGSANQSGAYVSIRLSARHAKWVLHGTQGPIVPRKSKTLAIRNPTRTAVVAHRRFVRGQAPNDFVTPAIRAAMKRHGH